MFNAYSALSSREGCLVHYELEWQEKAMKPNFITLPQKPLTQDLVNSRKNMRIGFQFKTTNPIPPTGIIQIQSQENFYFTLTETDTS